MNTGTRVESVADALSPSLLLSLLSLLSLFLVIIVTL